MSSYSSRQTQGNKVFPRLIIIFVSFYFLTTDSSPDPTYGARQLSWATFLGVTSALLAAMQYAPQIAHTYRVKLVGALSIKMMLIQSPGALLMVLSIALRSADNPSLCCVTPYLTNYQTRHKLDQYVPSRYPHPMHHSQSIQLGFRMLLLERCRQPSSSCACSGNVVNVDSALTTSAMRF